MKCFNSHIDDRPAPRELCPARGVMRDEIKRARLATCEREASENETDQRRSVYMQGKRVCSRLEL